MRKTVLSRAHAYFTLSPKQHTQGPRAKRSAGTISILGDRFVNIIFTMILISRRWAAGRGKRRIVASPNLTEPSNFAAQTTAPN